jgi:2-dehydropantoate 2-reductase
MKVGILGAGAMGSMFGGYLALAGHDVTLIDPWADHMDAVARDGLVMERPGREPLVAHPAATSDPASVGTTDVFIVLTKGFALREAAASIRHAVGPQTWVLTLGNGLGNDRVLAEVLGPERVVPGTTVTGSEAVGPGRIRISRLTADAQAVTHLGRPRTEDALPAGVVSLARTLTEAGLPTEAIENADVVIWTKLSIAGTMGPTTAALGRTIADVWETESGRSLIRAMYDEVVAVARAEGVPLDADELWKHCVQVWDGTNPEDFTSMAIDVLRRRPTEIESFSLEIVRRARDHGLEAPICETVGRMVKVLETPTLRTAPLPTA